MKNVSLLSLFEGVGSFGSFEESFEYKQPLKVVGRDGGLEEVRQNMIEQLIKHLMELTAHFDIEGILHEKVKDCALSLIRAALNTARVSETAKKVIGRYKKGWQTEKQGIRLRQGFLSEEDEQRWQEMADKSIEEEQNRLEYFYCYPTHGRSGKAQTLIRRIYQITRYFLNIDITAYKISWQIRLYDILKPLAGLDDYPDKQTFRKYLKPEARQNIDKWLNQCQAEKQNRVNHPIEERTRHTALN
ncbi:hypothetical protein [Neisseria cinerea]|uniref:Uncharacterized protein n=1 Tax=Neisseria cinerea TaxID=483 RepID=A0A7T3BPE4_NEICI|nr:hypothetical protein [Neisseria cinerea]QPT38574.1 hypothetical protein I6G28_03290 [Neisseria cinerea]SQF83601.1 Uncharacterised protein [Neisseria cinerea]